MTSDEKLERQQANEANQSIDEMGLLQYCINMSMENNGRLIITGKQADYPTIVIIYDKMIIPPSHTSTHTL
jgi:hypothetical protein